jgi:hypothetical protein
VVVQSAEAAWLEAVVGASVCRQARPADRVVEEGLATVPWAAARTAAIVVVVVVVVLVAKTAQVAGATAAKAVVAGMEKVSAVAEADDATAVPTAAEEQAVGAVLPIEEEDWASGSSSAAVTC